jgi:hypothetical protein
MKKKIVVLLLLILAGMWVVMSENGWCRMAPGPGHNPWDEMINCLRVAQSSPHIYNNANVDTENSAFNTNISRTRNVLKRGEESLTNFKKKEKNPGQVNK